MSHPSMAEQFSISSVYGQAMNILRTVVDGHIIPVAPCLRISTDLEYMAVAFSVLVLLYLLVLMCAVACWWFFKILVKFRPIATTRPDHQQASTSSNQGQPLSSDAIKAITDALKAMTDLIKVLTEATIATTRAPHHTVITTQHCPSCNSSLEPRQEDPTPVARINSSKSNSKAEQVSETSLQSQTGPLRNEERPKELKKDSLPKKTYIGPKSASNVISVPSEATTASEPEPSMDVSAATATPTVVTSANNLRACCASSEMDNFLANPITSSTPNTSSSSLATRIPVPSNSKFPINGASNSSSSALLLNPKSSGCAHVLREPVSEPVQPEVKSESQPPNDPFGSLDNLRLTIEAQPLDPTPAPRSPPVRSCIRFGNPRSPIETKKPSCNHGENENDSDGDSNGRKHDGSRRGSQAPAEANL